MAGGQTKLQFSCSKESMSVLVPDQDALRRRACIGERAQQLKTWFAAVQSNAWAYVNASTHKRPPRIFLVTEQTLATSYAISHEHQRSITCEVSVEANAEVPALLKAGVLTGYTLGRVSVSTGFQKVRHQSVDNSLYSLFFKVCEAPPIIIGKPPIEKLVRVHAYASALSF